MAPTQRKVVVSPSSAPKKIAKIQFGTMATEEIQKIAQLQVSSRVLFQMPHRNAAVNGCMDPRLGISDKASCCKTCGKRLTDCSGHFGYIQLELPVFHAGETHTCPVIILEPWFLFCLFLSQCARPNSQLTYFQSYSM